MSKPLAFMGLELDDGVLRTPNGEIPVAELTRAEFVRDVVKDGYAPSTEETSLGAVTGGAVIGGALLGPIGAVAGGALGSTVKNEEPGQPHFSTAAVQLVFETASDSLRLDIPREKEHDAEEFAKAVQKAMEDADG